ncbi:uncharacterized protein LOC111717490, partial [Eurytemora carolleeae]|uniref:uncharacterized protein LOC111717490 n=1 Tax=Eurytemora carolleeae TaxID=1294199 RepID=UPI000C77607B
MMGLVFLSLFFFFLKGLHGVEMNEPGKDRQGKFAGVFQVVRFPNANCLGSGGLNGTCYTESECTAKGGSASISCAAGFGICCIFSMSCGSTISQNNTYHVISNFNTVTDPSPCTYTVCPLNNNICKIRLDFETFTISGPATTTLTATAAIEPLGPSIGDCT